MAVDEFANKTLDALPALDDMPLDKAPPAGPPAPPEYKDGENLVPKLSEDKQKLLGAMVVENDDADWKSSEEMRQKRQRYYDLFCGRMPAIDAYSSKNILYVHMPYIAKHGIQFHAKMHQNRFPSQGDIVGVDIQRPSQRQRARKLSRHMNLCVRKLVPEYIPEHDSGGLQVLLYGDGFSVWYYSAVEERPCFEFCASDDVVVSYACKSKRPDMADVPRITWHKRKYRHELEAEQDKGYYVNVERLFPKPYGEDGQPPAPEAGDSSTETRTGSLTESSNQNTGTKPNPEDRNQPREILECDMMLALPGEERQRPVTICVDKMSKTVLRLALRERDDPKDAARYRREMAARDAAIDAAMVAHDAAMQEYQAAFDAFAAGPAPAVDEMGAAVVGLDGLPTLNEPPDPGEPPAPPKEPPMPKPARRIPFHRWTHYICIPNPEGFYNFGLAFLAEGANIAADELMSLCISLMRMNLLPTGFYSRMAKAPRGEFEMTLGKMTESHLPPEALQKAFYTFQFPQPDIVGTMKIEERLSKSVQDVAADEVIGGAPGMSGQTATETQERVANAMDSVSVINGRYDRARTNEMQVFAYVLSQTLPDDGYTFFEVRQKTASGAPGAPPVEIEETEEYTVTRDDYIEDFDVTFTTDPNVASKPQRIAQAQKVFGAVMEVVNAAPGGVPAVDPVTGVMMVRAAGALVIEAMDQVDIAAMLKAAPMPQRPGMPPAQGEGEENGEPGIDGGGGSPPPGMDQPPVDAASEGSVPPPA